MAAVSLPVKDGSLAWRSESPANEGPADWGPDYSYLTEDEMVIIFVHCGSGETFKQIARMLNLTEKPITGAYYKYCDQFGEKP